MTAARGSTQKPGLPRSFVLENMKQKNVDCACSVSSALTNTKQHSEWPFHMIFSGARADDESLVFRFYLCHCLAHGISALLLFRDSNHPPNTASASIATPPNFFFTRKHLLKGTLPTLVALRLTTFTAGFIWATCCGRMCLLDGYNRSSAYRLRLFDAFQPSLILSFDRPLLHIFGCYKGC